jgi:hypothetical protein
MMTLETGSGYEVVVRCPLSGGRARNLVVRSMGSALPAGIGRGDSVGIIFRLTTDN